MLNQSLVKSIAILLLGLGILPVHAAAQPFNNPVQVTTNPGEDFAPTVSPDGKLLVYASDRSGNLDLWMKFLGPGINPPDRQLTFHSATDTSPAFGPDGKQIVFVSHRSDPKGDLYLLDPEKRTPDDPESGLIRLTSVESPDTAPAWSPDGRFIYFSSENPRTKRAGVFKVEVATGNRTAVPGADGSNPSVSPDGRHLAYVGSAGEAGIWVIDLESGSRARFTSGPTIDTSPRWSADGQSIFFVRYHDDTDFDGQLSIDDRPNLWSVRFEGMAPGILRQLTDSSTYDLLPVPAGKGRLMFTSNPKNNIDIWELAESGLLPASSDYGRELQTAVDVCPGETPSYRCLMVFNNILLQFKDEAGLPRIRYRMARGYRELGHLDAARKLYAQMVETLEAGSQYKGLAEIERLLLDVEQVQEKGPSAYKAKLGTGLVALEKIAQRYQSQPQVTARTFLESGNLHFKRNEPQKALTWYGKVVEKFPGLRNLAAEASFAKSKVYSLVGDRARLVESYVRVVRDYYDVKLWTEKAIAEILILFETNPRLEKKVSSLQGFLKGRKGPARLAAAVQNRIGELYYNGGENLLAKEAYYKTLGNYSKTNSALFIARVSLADIYSEEENFDKSLAVFREIVDGSETVEESRRAAREGWVRKAIEKGKWEMGTACRRIKTGPENFFQTHRVQSANGGRAPGPCRNECRS